MAQITSNKPDASSTQRVIVGISLIKPIEGLVNWAGRFLGRYGPEAIPLATKSSLRKALESEATSTNSAVRTMKEMFAENPNFSRTLFQRIMVRSVPFTKRVGALLSRKGIRIDDINWSKFFNEFESFYKNAPMSPERAKYAQLVKMIDEPVLGLRNILKINGSAIDRDYTLKELLLNGKQLEIVSDAAVALGKQRQALENEMGTLTQQLSLVKGNKKRAAMQQEIDAAKAKIDQLDNQPAPDALQQFDAIIKAPIDNLAIAMNDARKNSLTKAALMAGGAGLAYANRGSIQNIVTDNWKKLPFVGKGEEAVNKDGGKVADGANSDPSEAPSLSAPNNGSNSVAPIAPSELPDVIQRNLPKGKDMNQTGTPVPRFRSEGTTNYDDDLDLTKAYSELYGQPVRLAEVLDYAINLPSVIGQARALIGSSEQGIFGCLDSIFSTVDKQTKHLPPQKRMEALTGAMTMYATELSKVHSELTNAEIIPSP